MLQLSINGQLRPVAVDPATPLLWVLRDELGLPGTKFGCGLGLCGSCTVHLDGAPIRACLTPVSAVGAGRITTIEDLGNSAPLQALERAWIALDVVQCGYCQPGQLMSAAALIAQRPRPTDAEIDEAMAGNLCRCTGYLKPVEAVLAAASGMAKPPRKRRAKAEVTR